MIRYEGFDKQNLNILAENDEKYIAISKIIKVNGVPIHIRFLDSYRFLPASLATLASQLSDDQFKITCALFPNQDLKLIRRKGIYPYDYVTDFSKFDECSLPPQQEFYSKIRGSGITDDDYHHAQLVWDNLKCRTFGDYHMAYLKLDVTLLADILQAFRKSSMQNYGLDP
ncbi:hypothetical protein SOP87_30245, partial [Bacillus cereus]|uniref:hypothetical protein n=1 Tax=Bacillus cereus TaxID=1396 RepID=UPI002B251537